MEDKLLSDPVLLSLFFSHSSIFPADCSHIHHTWIYLRRRFHLSEWNSSDFVHFDGSQFATIPEKDMWKTEWKAREERMEEKRVQSVGSC